MAKLQRTLTLAKVALPVKVWLQRFAVVSFVTLALGVMLLGKVNTSLVESARVSVTDAFAPILDVAAEPAQGVADFMEGLTELAVLREENQRLREENQRLLEWERTARALEAQNQALRELTSFLDVPAASQIAARIITDGGGVYVRSLLIAAGTAQGVAKGQAVVTGAGLVGRISEVGQRAARVLLVTDLNSRIPVRIERTRDRAILVGDNTDRPLLQYLRTSEEVAPGDRIVTSGDAGVFPSGIAVGEVVAVTDGIIRVQPFIDWDRLEYVRVLDYALPEVLEQFLAESEAREGGAAAPLGLPMPDVEAEGPPNVAPDPPADAGADPDAEVENAQ